MFTINDDNSIYVTRGDIVFFNVTAEDNGANYKFQPGDVVRIKVFGKKEAENVVLQKDFPVLEVTENVEIFLSEEETKIGEVISKPKDYWYEVELNPYDNPQTIIGYDEDGAKVFKLFPEGNDIPVSVAEPRSIQFVDDELDMTSTRPVQNQAVARAFRNLEDGYERTRAAVEELHVTPQMFGAIGDGKSDDTEAIQKAINASDYVFIPSGVYLISEPVVVEGSTGYYKDNGYRGKHILGTPSTKIIVSTNEDALIVRGFHHTIENLVLTFHPDLWGEYNHTLCLVESLTANSVKSSCNNLFKNIRCVSAENIWEHTGAFCGTGFKIISDGSNATYQNRFEGCVAADLYEGLVIRNGSTVGINANYYHIDLWNCNYLFKGNPSGSYFTGCNQAPVKLKDEENICFDLTGSDNVFDCFTYDVGSFSGTETPFLDLHSSRNNRFSQFVDLGAVRGSVKSNHIQATNISTYNIKVPYSLNNGIGSVGEGVQTYSIAPWDNGLRNPNYAKSITLSTEGVTVFDAASSSLYPNKTNGIPTEVSALAGKSMSKKMSFTCQEDAKFVFRFTLAERTVMDSLHLYFTHQRLVPKKCVVRSYRDGFGSATVMKREFDFSTAVGAYLTCLNLTVPYEPIQNDSFVELEVTFPAGVVGFAYLCAPMHSHFDGPVCEP